MEDGSRVADGSVYKERLLVLEDFLFFSLYSFPCIASNSTTLEKHLDFLSLFLFLDTYFEFSLATSTSPAPNPARYKDYKPGGDGLLHDHAGTSRTGERHGSGDHDCTDDDTDHNLPDADNRRSLPSRTDVRSHIPDEEDAPQESRETVVHHRHLSRENGQPAEWRP
jgi:hypothetical protein